MKKQIQIENKEHVVLLGTELVYRDTCSRHYKLGGGKRVWFRIRRLKCPHCKVLHRELPDVLAPFKHYRLDIIMGMLDGSLTTDDLKYENWVHCLLYVNTKVKKSIQSLSLKYSIQLYCLSLGTSFILWNCLKYSMTLTLLSNKQLDR